MEVVVLLETNHEHRQKHEPDYHPSGMFVKTVEYAKRFTATNNREMMQRMRECVRPCGDGGGVGSCVWGGPRVCLPLARRRTHRRRPTLALSA